MSLNSVVNNLVRAAAGIPSDISDTDLDAHVARLLSEEAKARESKWSELGLVGLLRDQGTGRGDSSDPSLPKTNKRFLASVIRTVDGHNSALLRAQAQAARDARDERRGESSRAGGASRLFGGALKGMSRDASGGGSKDRRDRGEVRDGRSSGRYRDGGESGGYERDMTREDPRSRRYGHDYEDGDSEKRHRHSRAYHEDVESSRSHRHRRSGRYDGDEDGDDRDGRDHDPSSRSRRTRYGYESESVGDDKHRSSSGREDDKRHSDSATRRESISPSKRRGRNLSSSPPALPLPSAPRPPSSIPKLRSPSPSPTPSASASPPLPPRNVSKMDRYFDSSYDPRLDLPAVPSQGLVQEVGWDNMLAILKERGKKRRNQSPTLSDSGQAPRPPAGVLPKPKRAYSPETLVRKAEKQERKERKARKEERRRRRGEESSEDERERRERKEKRRKEKEKDGEGGSTLLDGYSYVRKGGTREWDVGK